MNIIKYNGNSIEYKFPVLLSIKMISIYWLLSTISSGSMYIQALKNRRKKANSLGLQLTITRGTLIYDYYKTGREINTRSSGNGGLRMAEVKRTKKGRKNRRRMIDDNRGSICILSISVRRSRIRNFLRRNYIKHSFGTKRFLSRARLIIASETFPRSATIRQ